MNSDRNFLIGRRVRYYRTTQRWSLERLSKALGRTITAQALAKYEVGATIWRADMIVDVAKALRVEPHALLGVETKKMIDKTEDEVEAEKYKNILIELRPNLREFCYHIINKMHKINKEDGHNDIE